MTQELIPIIRTEVNGETQQTVDARALHAYLEVGTRFDIWIERRIEHYGFTENIDFVVMIKNDHNPQGGPPSKEYHLTMDMAKELAMVENNPQGRQARLYFIECERRAKALTAGLPGILSYRLNLLEEGFQRQLAGIQETLDTVKEALTRTQFGPWTQFGPCPTPDDRPLEPVRIKKQWMTPGDISRLVPMSPYYVGGQLKAKGYHWSQDPEHRFSRPAIRNRRALIEYDALTVLPAVFRLDPRLE
ncbi:MAG: antA/AntB antirepressor family protein [Deltaproteobacteria bacterium]|jgi:phage anti-repressor protein|nr:antA/AntB antirepressor family protein [Deltaproteobacteria bacterium]